MVTRSSFVVLAQVFPQVSRILSKELSLQVPQRTFTREEVGFLVLFLVKGVRINDCSFRIFFDQELGLLDTFIIKEFVRFYKDSLVQFHEDVKIHRINRQLRRS